MGDKAQGFGTAPVFFTAISTILGAILFLRFGYAVGNVGFLGTLGIIAIGHVVTISTAMAIAEIATNQKVEGGGEYYIISRSFGLNIGAAIGIALFFSQAISVAFYVIAFGEAFAPVLEWIRQTYHIDLLPQAVTLPAMTLLAALILLKGADLGVKALYVVVLILFASLALFFIGSTGFMSEFDGSFTENKLADGANFFTVFAICFPAFTGMTAGVGLSGDLENPGKSIPLGTLSATLFGMVMYVLVAYKLTISAPAEALSDNPLVMSDIALWGPIIPIGLAAATISSALGSIMVAPRTLQAIANDKVVPFARFNEFAAQGKGASSEPFNASLITIAIAFFIVALGNVNMVAEIISMFFMVTYGSLCLISFLQHFSADPSYRPRFRSKWYISLVGFVMCGALMFLMNSTYAIVSIVLMIGFYLLISNSNKDRRGLAAIFQGVVFQMSRQLQVFLQSAEKSEAGWRPSVVCVSRDTFKRYHAFDLLRWISHRYGFGTYIHLIKGYYSRTTQEDSRASIRKLGRIASRSNVFLDTIISPSYTSAIAQVIQLRGVSGHDNNMIMFEFAKLHPDNLKDIIDNFHLVKAGNFDVCILGSSERGFGHCQSMHIWIKPQDFENANLMILMGYIIWGHSDWAKADINIFAICLPEELEKQREVFRQIIAEGRLPISTKNIELLSQPSDMSVKNMIGDRSQDADLTIIGFRSESIKKRGLEMFEGYDRLGNILFVNSNSVKEIV